MRSYLALLGPLAMLAATPAAAQHIAYETIEPEITLPTGGQRNIAANAGTARAIKALASYGPFRVIDAGRAALVDSTDSRSPEAFSAMLRDYPGIATLDLVECPGTYDDLANLRLGRMIRAQGIATRVPRGGSVRSGAVELFLAGVRRSVDAGAEFAVHSWLDVDGHEPGDYDAAAPSNRRYLDYYNQMGMSPIEAEAFYAMTNSVPFDSARWFGAGVMGLWVQFDEVSMPDELAQRAPVTFAPVTFAYAGD